MQFPESWLREFCNPDLTTQQLADALTMAGLEVEELNPVAPAFSGVVVAEILSAEQHPNADRLRVCQVSTGQGEPLQIVCGAPNARAGIRVPLAQVGALLPPGEDGKPFEIKVGKLRGVESRGMLCSAKELGVADDHGGLLELGSDAPLGVCIREHLQLNDHVFVLKLTPNLAHCLSIAGVAREVSAITGAPLCMPAIKPAAVTHNDTLAVEIQAPDLCGRFSGRVVKGVNTQAQTPAWMAQRLQRCGQRPVSPLVDISNYVMFELGRPSHMFDLAKIQGGLQVRWGREGEQLKLLNGQTITLDPKVGVIADAQAVESLAGIMGGDATAVSDSTQNIFMEAAFWWPAAIAGRTRRYGFSTDAAHRFERGVEAESTVLHLERITQLVLDICGGSAGPMQDQVVQLPKRLPVSLRLSRAEKIIGMPVSAEDCVSSFERLGLQVQRQGDVLTVTPPADRFDLQIEEDLIEEVARMIGFNRLPFTPPQAPITPRLRAENRRGPFALRRSLAGLGYQETINFSFVEEAWERDLAGNANPIYLLNPIASQLSVMRSSLLGSLVSVLKFNLDRQAQQVRVFELGRVFFKDDSVVDTDTTVAGVHQPQRVAGLAYGPSVPTQWGQAERGVDFYDVKGDIEALLAPVSARFVPAQHPAMHPGRCAAVEVAGRVVGHVGELHPRWRQSYGLNKAPVLFELELDAVLNRPVPSFSDVPKHPLAERDLAVWVSDAITHDALVQAVRACGAELPLQQVTVFDIYRPTQANDAGNKSVAIRMVWGDGKATLTDAQVEAAMAQVVQSLQQAVSASVRA